MIARPEEIEIDGMGLLRGEVVPDRPVLFRWHLGTVPRDLVMGGFVELLLISDRVRSMLSNGQFTGWSTYPVRLLDRRGGDIPGYHGLAVTGRKPTQLSAVQRSWDAGGIEDMVWRLRSDDDLYLDGSSSFVVVTRPVAAALRAGKVTNLHLVPVA